MAATNVTIKIEAIRLVNESDPYAHSYYLPNTEHYVYHASIFARNVDTGAMYSFSADNLKMRVSSAGPAAVVTFDNEGDFITKPDGYAVMSGVDNKGGAPQLKHSAGDVITIRCTMKNGKPTRVKLVK